MSEINSVATVTEQTGKDTRIVECRNITKTVSLSRDRS